MASQFNEFTAQGRLHCSAGDFLLIGPLLAHAAEKRLAEADDSLKDKAASLMATQEVIMLTLRCKASSESDMHAVSARLDAALSRRMKLRLKAYGAGGFKPKHHFNMHTPSQLRADGRCFDMFLLERHHKRLKQLSEDVCNLQFTSYEISCMRSACTALYGDLQTPPGTILGGLGEPVLVEGTPVARRLTTRCGKNFDVGDFVQRGFADVGKVVACACVADGRLALRVNLYRKKAEAERSALHVRACQCPGNFEMWSATECYSITAWYDDHGDVVLLF